MVFCAVLIIQSHLLWHCIMLKFHADWLNESIVPLPISALLRHESNGTNRKLRRIGIWLTAVHEVLVYIQHFRTVSVETPRLTVHSIPIMVHYWTQKSEQGRFKTPSRSLLSYLDCGGEVYATYSLGVTTDDQDNQIHEQSNMQCEWWCLIISRFGLRRRQSNYFLTIAQISR